MSCEPTPETGTVPGSDGVHSAERGLGDDTLDHGRPLTPSEQAQARHVAAVERELAMFDALDEATKLRPRRTRRTSGSSVVFSFRLDPAELAALEARAALTGIKPTVLARNLVRTGLSVRDDGGLASAVDELEAAVTQLRSLVW